MRKIIIALTTVVVIVFLMIFMSQAEIFRANFLPGGTYPTIDIHSPLPQPYIYSSNHIEISIDYSTPSNWAGVNSFSYSLDRTENHTLNLFKNAFLGNYYSITGTLTNLANGNHTINVYAYFVNGTARTVLDETFTIDTTFLSPILTITSPVNSGTYNTNEVELTYSMNSKVIWAFYALDDPHSQPTLAKDWASFNGSTSIVLTNLSEGPHKISVAVYSEAHEHTRVFDQNLYSIQTSYFTIDTKSK
jgi:hypothetical protein